VTTRANREDRPTPLARRDLAWRDNDVVWGVLDDAAPDPAEVRAALRALARSGGDCRFLHFLDADRGTSWRADRERLDALIDELVVASTDVLDEAELACRVERTQKETLAPLPFQFTVGPGWAIMHFCHALGDAGTVWPLYMGLMKPDRLRDFVQPTADPRFPLLLALWATFGRRPSRLWRAMRSDRSEFPLGSSSSVPFGATVTQVVARRSAPGFRRELSELRKSTAPGASAVGMLVARAMSTARAAGLEPFPGVGMVADVRRHLPDRSYRGGNFTAGAYLGLGDPTDPLEITEAIDNYSSSARPLLTLSLMAAGTRRGPRTEPVWDEPDEGPRTLVTFSHVGRLPWPAEPPRLGFVLGKPIGQHGLAIVTHEMGRYLYASVSFDERFVNRSAAQAIAGVLVELD
jgi:hypothetical protein